jgi:hypothetical protein
VGLIDCSCATDTHEDGGLVHMVPVNTSALACDDGLYVVTEEQAHGSNVSGGGVGLLIDEPSNALWSPMRGYGVDAFGRTTADLEDEWSPAMFYSFNDADAATYTPAGQVINASAATVTTKNFYTAATLSGHWVLNTAYQSRGMLARIQAQAEIWFQTSRFPSATTDGDGVEARIRMSENGLADITIAFDKVVIKDHRRSVLLKCEFWRYLTDSQTYDFSLTVTRLGTNNGSVLGVRKAWAAWRQC